MREKFLEHFVVDYMTVDFINKKMSCSWLSFPL